MSTMDSEELLKEIEAILSSFSEKKSLKKIDISKENFRLIAEKHEITSKEITSLPETKSYVQKSDSEPLFQNSESELVFSQESKPLHSIVAPTAGVFWAASRPDLEPFVKEGFHIEKNMPLCIIEIMKTFNEILSDVSGIVKKVNKKNKEFIKKGEVLFLIQIE